VQTSEHETANKPPSETTLSANKSSVKTTIIDNETTIIANKAIGFWGLENAQIKEYLSGHPVCLLNKSGQYLEKTH